MDKTFSGVITFLGIAVSVTTNNRDYVTYLSEHFGSLFNEGDFQGTADVTSQVNWFFDMTGKQSLTLPSTENSYQLGGSVTKTDDQLTWIKKIGSRRLRLTFSVTEKPVAVNIQALFHKKVLKDILKERLLGKNAYQTLFELTYHCIYYPVLYLLKRRNFFFPMHAASVFTPKGALVFAGFEGIGKSTLSLLLSQREGCRFMSDNLILYDKQKICGIPEPIRLHKSKLVSFSDSLYKINKKKQLKDFFGVKDRYDKWSAPYAILTLSFASSFQCEELSADEIASYITSVDNLVGELVGFREFTSFANLLCPDVKSEERQQAVLQELLSKTRIFRVGIPKGVSPENTLNKIQKKIEL